jgi:lysophospholipase L1-like esterase
MARTRKDTGALKFGAVVLSATIWTAPGWSQSGAPAAVSSMPAPFSRDCQIGETSIINQSPLPNVASALKERKQIKILTIGASSSIGRRAARGGYAEQIRDILKQAVKGIDVVMVNRGVSGELAANAAERIRTEVALTEPDLVLWQVGTNDALSYIPLERIETAVVDTVRWLKEHKVDVVLAGLQYTDRMKQDEHYREVRELMRKIAAQENVIIVRRYEAQRLMAQAAASGGGLEPDEFQRSEAGYACLAQYMARAITLGIFAPTLRPRELQRPPQPPAEQPK